MREPLQPSVNIVCFAFIWIPGEYVDFFEPSLAIPKSPVMTPPTLPSPLNTTLSPGMPGKISTPRASAYSPSQMHNYPKLIMKFPWLFTPLGNKKLGMVM